MTARDALAVVRADVDKANSPSPVSNRYGAELRIVERHAPAMLRALEAVLDAIDRADPPGAMKAGTPTVSVAVLRSALSPLEPR